MNKLVEEMIVAALEGSALKFKEMFDEAVGTRVNTVVEHLKPVIADDMFNSEEELTAEAVNLPAGKRPRRAAHWDAMLKDAKERSTANDSPSGKFDVKKKDGSATYTKKPPRWDDYKKKVQEAVDLPAGKRPRRAARWDAMLKDAKARSTANDSPTGKFDVKKKDGSATYTKKAPRWDDYKKKGNE